MKTLIIIIALMLAFTVGKATAQNQPAQTLTPCEWNQWVTVYDCGGMGHSIRVEYFDIVNLGKFETRHISKKVVAYWVGDKIVIQERRRRKRKVYTAILTIKRD